MKKQTKAERIYEDTKNAIRRIMRDRHQHFDCLNRCETTEDELVYKRTQNAMFDLWNRDIKRLERDIRLHERYCEGETRDWFRQHDGNEVEVLRRTYLTIANQWLA